MSYIILKNVCKSYQMGKNVIPALHNISMEVEKGEFAVVLGPSGSGKITFLNILGGLEMADSGDVCVESQSITGFADAQLTEYRLWSHVSIWN